MDILNTLKINSNPKIEINFDGGELSSDSGLFLMKEFLYQIGFMDILKECFSTKDTAAYRKHSDIENLLQSMYQIFAGYFEDDRADSLTNEPVFTACLEKESLASQPTMSRFFNRLDETTIGQFNEIMRRLRKVIYSIEGCPNTMLFDLDTTLLNTYGSQEGAAWNYHYEDTGYHPQMCFNGLNGDLIRIQLRKGTQYCSTDVTKFMEPIFKEYTIDYPYTNLFVRCDSGYAAPEIYEQCEQYGAQYVIRLKANSNLYKLAAELEKKLYEKTKEDTVSHAVVYGEFMYQATSWEKERRVVCKIEKPANSMEHRFTFIVTNMTASCEFVIGFYCKRGQMENFIKECKNDFDFASTSSKSMVVNDNRVQIHGLVYNIVNAMRRLVFPKHLLKARMETIRINLVKIASRLIRHGRKIQYRLCSSCPYQSEFRQVLDNIHRLQASYL